MDRIEDGESREYVRNNKEKNIFPKDVFPRPFPLCHAVPLSTFRSGSVYRRHLFYISRMITIGTLSAKRKRMGLCEILEPSSLPASLLMVEDASRDVRRYIRFPPFPAVPFIPALCDLLPLPHLRLAHLFSSGTIFPCSSFHSPFLSQQCSPMEPQASQNQRIRKRW